MSSKSRRRVAAVALPVVVASVAAVAGAGSSAAEVSAAGRVQNTKLISRSFSGGVPNGPSSHGVISNDRRFARVIAFQSDASNIVRGDRNRQTDVFAIKRKGPVNNNGTRWRPGKTVRISRARGGRTGSGPYSIPSGQPNGPSYAPAVDGAFKQRPRCVAFISEATNIARRDRNGVADAFVSRGPGRFPRRVSLLPGNRATRAATTRVAVSGDCSRIAFVAGGKLYVRSGNGTRRINVPGRENDPSFSTGRRNDLVFAGGRGIYLAKNARRPRRVTKAGRDPAYNDIKRQVLAWEQKRGCCTQIWYKDLGKRARVISGIPGRHAGNGDSRDPVIGNSGYYVSFESEASNLWINAEPRTGDSNGNADVYLYTDVRNLTLAESVDDSSDIVPAGAVNPSMSFYANYILWDSPANLRSGSGPRQVFMRWLGPV
jgi:hypothetical protein